MLFDRALIVVGITSLIAACSPSNKSDAGARPDAVVVLDATTHTDAGVSPDATERDATEPDATEPDATADAAESDALPDASTADAETSDAGEADAGFAPDAAPVRDAAVVAGCMAPPPYVAPSPASVGIPAVGLATWIRADLGLSLDGMSGVCSADDLSGSAHGFAQLTPSARPTVGAIGSQPALEMTGAQFLQTDGVLGTAATSSRTIVVVTKLEAISARSTFFLLGAGGTPGTYIGIEANTFNTRGNRWGAYFTNNAYDGQIATSTVPVIAVWRTDSMVVGEPVLSHLSVRINGVALTLARTPGGLGNGNIESISNADFTAIGISNPAQHFEVAEVLVWSYALSSTEIAEVEAYLASRYGIAL